MPLITTDRSSRMSPRASFGEVLRRHRLAANVTQEELAERAGLSVRTISDLERGVHRSPRRDTARELARALGLDDDALRDFEAVARPRTGEDGPQTSLPLPSTPLIGRDAELAAITSVVQTDHPRIVTLAGPAGVGKTRLALEVAQRARRGDAVFVSLAEVADFELVPFAIARALGLHAIGHGSVVDQVITQLRASPRLLLLDNFEHLIPAVDTVAQIVAAAPDVKVLVTSRTALRIRGEQIMRIDPLAVGVPAARQGGRRPSPSPAIELLVQRGLAADPDWPIDDTETLAEICRRLDGLPLAIELAAAQSPILAPDAMLERLDRRLPTLTRGPRDLPDRQQTLRRAIDWSHELLDEPARVLFRRLAIFSGGWTLESAEEVCLLDDEQLLSVIGGLGTLVENNLVRAVSSSSGARRFTMLETIAAYAREALVASGELEALQRRHARHFLSLAEEVEARLTGHEQVESLERLEDEGANLRAALRWSLDGDPELGLRMAGALWRFWERRGYLQEGLEHLTRLLTRSHGAAPDIRARALIAAGNLTRDQGRLADAEALHEAALADAREAGDRHAAARVLNNLGALSYDQGRHADARIRYEESLALAESVDDPVLVDLVLMNLALVLGKAGSPRGAVRLLRRSMALAQQRGDAAAVADRLENLATVLQEDGHLRWAGTLHQKAVALAIEAQDTRIAVYGVEGLAIVAALSGSGERAVRLFGAAEALRETRGDTRKPVQEAAYERAIAAARATLTPQRFAAAWASGRQRSLEEAADDATVASHAADRGR